MYDKMFLLWLYGRLKNVYKAEENIDWMRKLMSIIESTSEDQLTPNTSTTKLQDKLDEID